jgi:hypothetical protein
MNCFVKASSGIALGSLGSQHVVTEQLFAAEILYNAVFIISISSLLYERPVIGFMPLILLM